MNQWPHERDVRDYFDGKLEADLGLHGSGFEPSAAPDPTSQHHPPRAKEARAHILRVQAVLERLSKRNIWILAAYYTRIRPCDRNGFRELITYKVTEKQQLEDTILPPADEDFSRIAMTTKTAMKEAERVLGRKPETMSEVRTVVRALRNGGQNQKKSPEKVADIVEEAKALLKAAQKAYDNAVAEIEVEVLMAKRREFLEGL